jgi:hypothetical protein
MTDRPETTRWRLWAPVAFLGVNAAVALFLAWWLT